MVDQERPAAGRNPKSGFDRASAAMALATALVLAVVIGVQCRPEPIGDPPGAGATAPPLGLIDARTNQPTLVFARPERVLWVAFWSPRTPGATQELERIWRRFRARKPFMLVVVALDAGDAARLEKSLGDSAPELPIYVATAATRRDFGVAEPPLHFLIDEDGRVVATARGDGENLEGMATAAEGLLDAIDQPRDRFARIPGAAIQPPGSDSTKATNFAVSRSGAPWPKQTRAGSSAASRRAASRFLATPVEKKWGGSCRPGSPVSGWMFASTSPAIRTRSAARQ